MMAQAWRVGSKSRSAMSGRPLRTRCAFYFTRKMPLLESSKTSSLFDFSILPWPGCNGFVLTGKGGGGGLASARTR
jgi:hypothetical protein